MPPSPRRSSTSNRPSFVPGRRSSDGSAPGGTGGSDACPSGTTIVLASASIVTLEDTCSSREVERLDGGSSVVAGRDRGSSESSASQRVQRGLNGEFSALHPGQMITLSPR